MAGYYFRVPRYNQLPHLCTMLDSIGNDREVARLFGLAPSTVRRYRRSGQAPRPIMYALFWETPWGSELADCNAINDARIAYSQARLLERQNTELRRQIALLERELSTSQYAANAPIFRVA